MVLEGRLFAGQRSDRFVYPALKAAALDLLRRLLMNKHEIVIQKLTVVVCPR